MLHEPINIFHVMDFPVIKLKYLQGPHRTVSCQLFCRKVIFVFSFLIGIHFENELIKIHLTLYVFGTKYVIQVLVSSSLDFDCSVIFSNTYTRPFHMGLYI